MVGNPLVDQGTLNRIRGSIVVSDLPELNVTAPFLGKAGISLSLEGETTLYQGTMTGAVTSPEPYMMVAVTVNLLKTQALSALYKARMELLSTIGNVVVIPDARTLPNYAILNCAIRSIRELSFNGEDAGFGITLGGYYNINSGLFDLT